MERSNTGVITEYTGHYSNKKFPYYFNFEKCQIRFRNSDTSSYTQYTYLASSKNKVYERFTDGSWWTPLTELRNSSGTHFIAAHRSLFKIINEVIIPIAIIDHNLDIHIQSDVFIDRWERGLLKIIVTGAAGEVTLHDNLAGEFFLHPNVRFKNLKERREIEDQFTQKLVKAYTIVNQPHTDDVLTAIEDEESVSEGIDEILDDVEFDDFFNDIDNP